jgi:hypothetical protein
VSQRGVDETLFTPIPTLQQACLAVSLFPLVPSSHPPFPSLLGTDGEAGLLEGRDGSEEGLVDSALTLLLLRCLGPLGRASPTRTPTRRIVCRLRRMRQKVYRLQVHGVEPERRSGRRDGSEEGLVDSALTLLLLRCLGPLGRASPTSSTSTATNTDPSDRLPSAPNAAKSLPSPSTRRRTRTPKLGPSEAETVFIYAFGFLEFAFLGGGGGGGRRDWGQRLDTQPPPDQDQDQDQVDPTAANADAGPSTSPTSAPCVA